MVQVPAAGGQQCIEKLMGNGCAGNRHIQGFSRFHNDVQILIMEFALEPWSKITHYQPFAAGIHHPGLCVSPALDFEDNGRVHTGFGAQHKGFCHADEVECHLDLIAGFDRLSCTVPAAQGDCFPHHLKNG